MKYLIWIFWLSCFLLFEYAMWVEFGNSFREWVAFLLFTLFVGFIFIGFSITLFDDSEQEIHLDPNKYHLPALTAISITLMGL